MNRKPDEIIGGEENPYMLRWWLFKSRLFNLYLHKFIRDDDDRAMHDHPWWSLSIILKGDYREVDDRGIRLYHRFSFRLRSAVYRHRIILPRDHHNGGRVPCWTLFFTGPKVREWGFHCPKGWRHWKEFADRSGNKIGKGCAD